MFYKKHLLRKYSGNIEISYGSYYGICYLCQKSTVKGKEMGLFASDAAKDFDAIDVKISRPLLWNQRVQKYANNDI